MTRMRKGTLAALALLGCTVAVVGTAAVAYGSDEKPVPAVVSEPDALEGAPRKYAVVVAGPLTSNDGEQNFGSVVCPGTTVPWGGGVFSSSFSLGATVNSSYPSGNGWGAYVNNWSGADTTFYVVAVCAKKPRRYQVVVSSGNANPTGFDAAVVSCPARTVPLGGGAVSSSFSTQVAIVSSHPSGNGWRIEMHNNALFEDATFDVYAVCGKKPMGYAIVAGAAVTSPQQTQTGVTAPCPAPTVPIGGGVYSVSDPGGYSGVHLNSTYAVSGGWRSYVNNNTYADTPITPYAVCAGT